MGVNGVGNSNKLVVVVVCVRSMPSMCVVDVDSDLRRWYLVCVQCCMHLRHAQYELWMWVGIRVGGMFFVFVSFGM